MEKACVACAEDIKFEAKLCKHCGTRQDEQEFSKAPKSASYKKIQTNENKTKTNACPKCGGIDYVAKVSAIVDSGRVTSSSMGFTTQMGSGNMPFTSLSAGSSSSHLADRLTIYIPQVEFQYKFVDFLMGCFLAGVPFFGFVFKEGSPLDSGPFNVIFASIMTLAIGPIVGIGTAVARKNNQARNIFELQLLMEHANEKLRNSYYCSRDDLVFNKKRSSSPEDFIEYLINSET